MDSCPKKENLMSSLNVSNIVSKNVATNLNIENKEIILQNKIDDSKTNINFKKVINDALGGGIPGMVAMVAQVSSLMWLRTTMNYQYAYGTTMTQAMNALYKQGGISRFYTGYTVALIQGPLSRFGDTASNMGVMSLMEETENFRKLPLLIKTAFASTMAACFRILLMPVDTCKTILQVEGNKGWNILTNKVRLNGPSVLFHGSLASASATLAGHYPWYMTYNYLSSIIPEYRENVALKLSRSAFIGFVASIFSDSISNSFRVVKTARQASKEYVTYSYVISSIIKKDGISGLMGRGLKTRLMTNAIQGLAFSVFWKLGQDYWKEQQRKKNIENE